MERIDVTVYTVGTRVRSKVPFYGVPAGTQGLICQDYGDGIMVAWDMPDRPLPDLKPEEIATMYAIDPNCPLRDGFSNYELRFLEVLA